MREHRAFVVQSMTRMDGKARLLFGLLITERLRACCFANTKSGESWQVFCEAIETGFEMVCGSTHLDRQQIIEIQNQLEEHVPAGGEPLQVQSQSAWLCLLEAFRASHSESSDSIEGVVNGIVDALDNYAFFVQRWLTGRMSSPDSYLLLDREVQKQLEDLQYVEGYRSYSDSEFLVERERNMQFAVPVAIGGKASGAIDKK